MGDAAGGEDQFGRQRRRHGGERDMDGHRHGTQFRPGQQHDRQHGFAGGALGSLLSAVLRIFGYDFFLEAWSETPAATYLGVAAYLALCALLYGKAVSAKATTN